VSIGVDADGLEEGGLGGRAPRAPLAFEVGDPVRGAAEFLLEVAQAPWQVDAVLADGLELGVEGRGTGGVGAGRAVVGGRRRVGK
jgi:hypothetical protein